MPGVDFKYGHLAFGPSWEASACSWTFFGYFNFQLTCRSSDSKLAVGVNMAGTVVGAKLSGCNLPIRSCYRLQLVGDGLPDSVPTSKTSQVSVLCIDGHLGLLRITGNL